MSEEKTENQKENSPFRLVIDISILIILIVFFLWLRIEGYYKSEYIVVNSCGKSVQIAKITQQEWQAKYDQLKAYKGITITDLRNSSPFLNTCTNGVCND